MEQSHEINEFGKLTIERPLIRDVVHKKDAHRAAVVGGCDGAESFLAGRIPDL